ncbi:MAG: hypothetical protein KDA25_12430 [Phycisphaerales bacterium]|nr:hypothetical protein [Phycisphaerales bacterium]
MHDRRNLVLVCVFMVALVWTIASWFVLGADTVGLWQQKFLSVGLTLGLAAFLAYAFTAEDKLPDHLGEAVGEVYYDADGICFMVTVRQHDEVAYLSVYYQNRYENPAHAIIHLRPPADSFCIRPGWGDVHVAFMCDGGDFGVIHQPIGVPTHLQGDIVNIGLAAASYYPRSHGGCLRRRAGLPCGSLLADWRGGGLRTGVYDVSDEIPLRDPVTLHLSMPTGVATTIEDRDSWVQRQLVAGNVG